MLDVLHSERFVDQAPAAVYYTLLDEGVRHCSVRTMYRILESQGEVRERRNQLTHPTYKKPELLATGPNQVWSWDITKLLGPAKWTYHYLYVLLDIYSRYVVGWMLADRESGDLAKLLIAESCDKQGIQAGQLTIHSDRGPAMQAKGLAQLLADMGITKTNSRPHVSNDNPFSESQFKTMKYRPQFPRRFGSKSEGLDFCRAFVSWYNQEHRHSALAYLTPETVHNGRAGEVLSSRQALMMEAYAANPSRFIGGPPQVLQLPEAVWINPPAATPTTENP